MARQNVVSFYGGIGDAFSDRNFRIYSVGAITTWVGFFLQLVAVSWHAWELTHSTRWLAIIALLDIVPNIVLMPLAGAVADRLDKYWLMGFFSLLALIQTLIITFLAWTGDLTIWPFALLVLFHGIIISFMVPAMYGILPRFVKRSCLTSSIAVSTSYSQLAIFLGPAIAGWIISTHGVAVAFGVNTLCYLVYLISWLFLKTPDDFVKPVKSKNSLFGDITEGFIYIRHKKEISSFLVLLLAGGALSSSIFHMAPAVADEILDMGVIGVSVILSSKGIGATLAAIWLAYRGEQSATVERLLWGFLIFTLSVVVIFVFKKIYILILAFLIMGAAVETYKTIMLSIIQLSVTEEQRGRVMGTVFMITQIASGIGVYFVGYYASNHGLLMPMLFSATICLIVWIVYFIRRNELIGKV